MADDAELDVDGDGQPDVRVPGLGGDGRGELHAGRDDTEAIEAIVDARMPPETSPYSPMGQVEHFGYALSNQTARTGWRGVVIRVAVWTWLAALALTALVSLIR